VPKLGEVPVRGVFIRAPIIESVGAGVEVLAELDGKPVLVQQDNILASTFHPELTDDPRLHRYFVQLCRG
jgi:5'-phosphate synthase pdxT subunit